MVFYPGGEPVPVRWYWAAEDAQFMEGPCVYRSRVYQLSPREEDTYNPPPGWVGEVPLRKRRRYNGAPALPDVAGDHVCGSPESWASGAVRGVDSPLVILAGGLALCCVEVMPGIIVTNQTPSVIYTDTVEIDCLTDSGLFATDVSPSRVSFQLLAASATQMGAMTAGAQTFAGEKTFNGEIVAPGGIWAVGGIGFGSAPGLGTPKATVSGGDLGFGRGRLYLLAQPSSELTIDSDGLNYFDVVARYGYNFGPAVTFYDAVTGNHTGASGSIAPGATVYKGLVVGLGSGTVGTITGGDGGDTGLTLTGSPILTLGGVLKVTHGGTGSVTLPKHDVLLGNDTAPLSYATVGTAGRVLVDQGATLDPAFVAIGGDAELDGFGDLTIQPGVITYSKIQDVGSHSLLGNPTGADTVATEVRLGPGLAWSSDSITLTTLAVQSANTVLAGPITGGSDTPSFRALVPNDIPALSAAKITSGVLGLAEGGTGADLSATGGVGQYVTQSSAGGVFRVGVIPAADVPTISGGKIGSGTVGLGVGGTGTDLSATGGTGKLLFQETTGGAVTVRSLASADVPNLSAAKITSGTLALAVGGTGANLSATGGGDTILAQPVLGGAVVPTSLAAMLDALGGISGSFG